MTSHVQLFRLQMALCRVLQRPAVGRLRKPAPFCPRRVGPVTHSQVQDPPSGLRHTPHVLMAPLVRGPELRMVTWLFLSFFSCQCELCI